MNARSFYDEVDELLDPSTGLDSDIVYELQGGWVKPCRPADEHFTTYRQQAPRRPKGTRAAAYGAVLR